MWGGRFKGRHIVALVVGLGVLVELPLLAYILTRDNGKAAVVETQTTTAPANTFASLPSHPIAGRFKPDHTKISDCRDQTCFQQAYGNVAYYQGPKKAFALVAKQYANGADPACHPIAHLIGAATLARNHGNVARTFSEGSSMCWSGYYHGVLERAFLDVKSFTAKALGRKARSLCSDRQVRASSWLAYQCLHGLGHGLMITTAYQLPLALNVCRQLDTDWDRTSCKGGVFMENILTSYGGTSPWVRDDDPLYPCDWVAEQDKYTCYQQATTRIVRVVGYDWPKVASACAKAETKWITTCFGSFGQNVSVATGRKPRQIVHLCADARPYGGEEECVRYAAMDIAGAYLGGKQAAVLCNLSTGHVRDGCYRSIGHMFWYFERTTVARSAACRALVSDRHDTAECIKGTTEKSLIPGLTRSPAQ